jgi:superfamily II DNA or RNA helicase
MKLRQWQNECIGLALDKFLLGETHFLCLASPGAGKTMMAASVAKQLMDKGSIDFILCVSPSVSICHSTKHTFESLLNTPFNGKFGSSGMVITYQSLPFHSNDLWQIFDHYKVLVVLDEVHHCAGQSIEDSNAWGLQVLTKLQRKATFFLTLTGTPWRTDNALITSVEYCKSFGQATCDYQYGMASAISDGVCRPPVVTAIDNNKIAFSNEHDGIKRYYPSLAELMDKEALPYQSIIDNHQILTFCLREADEKLNEIRQSNMSAGGLVVASSIEHAHLIAYLFKTELNQSTRVVTHCTTNSEKSIDDFRRGNEKWLISVGMVSEGTDIPRLQVCCHLTRIRTELHFRQILGRIMRVNKSETYRYAHLYVPAQPDIIRFSKRLRDDLPEDYQAFEELALEQHIDFTEQKVSSLEAPENDLDIDNVSTTERVNSEVIVGGSHEQESGLLFNDFLTNLSLEGRFEQYSITI